MGKAIYVNPSAGSEKGDQEELWGKGGFILFVSFVSSISLLGPSLFAKVDHFGMF